MFGRLADRGGAGRRRHRSHLRHCNFMKCPICEKWSTVLETRNHSRRRECGNGHRFTTREVVIENPRSAAMYERWANEGQRQQLKRKRDDNGKFVA